MMTIDVGTPVGYLHQVADRFCEALFRVVEVSEIFDLVDAEHQRSPVDDRHDRADRLNDLEGAAVAGVGVERLHALLAEFV